MVRVGVVGCGAIARLAHVPVLERLSHVSVVALADPDADARAAARCLAPGANEHADHRSLLARDDVDAVVIASPTALHAGMAIEAIRAGKHVYVEKPLATSVATARDVIAAADASTLGRVRAVGFNYRFNPLLVRARELLAAHRIGDLVAVQMVFSTSRRAVPTWKRMRMSGGGALLDLGAHHIDLLHWLVGDEVVAVSASVRSRHAEEDCVALRLELRGGTLVQAFFSLASVEEDRIEVLGEDGRIVIDRYGAADVQVDAPLVRDRRGARVARVLRSPLAFGRALARRRAAAGDPSYRRALAEFIHAVREGRAFGGASLADGVRVAEVIAAAEESARTRRTVALGVGQGDAMSRSGGDGSHPRIREVATP